MPGDYKYANGHMPGFASSYVVLRRAGGVRIGTVAQSAGRWIVKHDGERYFFSSRHDAAQALDIADRIAYPVGTPDTEGDNG